MPMIYRTPLSIVVVFFLALSIIGIVSSVSSQDSIAIYAEHDDGSLKGKTGRAAPDVFHYRQGKFHRHKKWSESTRKQGWHFSFSRTGRVVYVAGVPSQKAGFTELRYYLAQTMSPPDFDRETPFFKEEVKRTDPYPPSAGLSISWGPDEQRFFVRRSFDLTVFENTKKLGKLNNISWSWGVNWASGNSSLAVADHDGRKHWVTGAPVKGDKSFDPKSKPYINYQLRAEKLFEEKVYSSCYRVLYSPNGKYIAYAKAPGERPLVNPSLNKVSEVRYNGPVTGFTSLRIGVRGKSNTVESFRNSAKLLSQEKFKSGFSGKVLVNGEVREIDWTQITPIGWSPQSDAFYYVVSKFTGKDVWSFSNRKKEGVFGQLKSNELWRATPVGKKFKVCDLNYLPDRNRYCGNMASRFPDRNQARISSDGKQLVFWGGSTDFYKKNLTKLESGEVNQFIPGRASKFARNVVLVDLPSRKEKVIFTASERSRELSVAGFVGSELKIDSLTALDANPIYFGDGNRLPTDFLPTQLITADKRRKGTTADGVSQLILRAEVSENVPVAFRIAEGDGEVEPLLGGKTVSLQGKHYAIALYTPPKNFVGGSSKKRPLSTQHQAARPHRLRGKSTLEIDALRFEAVPYRPAPDGTAQPVITGKKELDLHIARPPVVLVHGLGSNPIECWVATKTGGQSMVVALERMGIQPFCVNYEKSNGLNDPDSPHNDKIFVQPDGRDSTFFSNRNVVWDSPDGEESSMEFLNAYQWLGDEPATGWLGVERIEKPVLPKPAFLKIGGIKQALAFYRDELDLAVTQADVVGHSMGGLLARVHADPKYNPSYKRPENYNQGDIHRLITICTPHHGSELAMLYNEVFRNLVIDDEDFVEWARRNVQQKLLTMFLDPDSGAITDLRYRSAALQRIGRTLVPSYAIATTANSMDLGNPHVDPTRKYLQLYSGIAMALFHNRPRLDAWIERRALRWSNASDELRKNTDRLENESLSWAENADRNEFKNLLAANINTHSYYWLKRREGAYREKLYKQIQSTSIVPFGFLDSEMGQDDESSGIIDGLKSLFSDFLLGGDVSQMHRVDQEPDIPYEVVEMIRSLIFHCDSKNDGAVRLDSQIGGIASSKTIEGVVHSFAPWDEQVQNKVVELLKWDDRQFFRSQDKSNPNTFGPAGQLMPYWLPSTSLSSPFVYGDDAIAWSGMVKSHAQQYLHLSEQKDVVIIARPVNLDSTLLIEKGAATKGMDIKGKSSNWGPQKGYIPVMQRFSKLWRVYADQPDVRKKKIAKFNGQTVEMLESATYPNDGKEKKYRGRKFAVRRALEVELPANSASDVGKKKSELKKYSVVINPDPKIDAENAIYLKDSDGIYYDWRNAIDHQSGKPVKIFHYDFPPMRLKTQPAVELAAKFKNMEVLADNLQGIQPAPYLTADYDLLAIGFRNQGFEGPHPDVARAMESGKAPKLTGYISQPQLDLIEDFNDRCDRIANYKSGYLTHHGPETQYPGSEYVDYPLLVFDPGLPVSEDDDDAKYFLIKQGPPGFRDIHLKNYFWEKKKLGHNLWPNPVSQGWLWEDEASLRKYTPERGYDPRDAAGLLKYVAPQRMRSIQVSGIASNNRAISGDDVRPLEELEQLRSQAKAGDPKAQFALAFALGSGKLKSGSAIQADGSRAVYWYRRSANQGNRVAQYNLAKRLASGNGVTQSDSESAFWYLKSAELGFEKALVPAGYRLQYGKGIRQDYNAASKLYMKAVEKGHLAAANNLGVMFENGQGVEKDYAQAKKYYELAANKNHALATKNLGDLYFSGKGVDVNYQRALQYYLKAKSLGQDSVDDDIAKARKQLKQ